MAGTSGKTLSQLKAERSKLISQGKTLSTSKELGKIENAIKVLEPHKYDDKQVASAKKALASSNKPNSSGSSSSSSGSGGSTNLNDIFNTGDISGVNARLSQLDSELAEKQRAKAEQASVINDNPFYSEATRVGKISKLDEKANADINNLLTEKATEEGRLANLKNDILTQYNINLQQQQLSTPQVQFYQDGYGNQIKLTLDPRTGKTIATENLGGAKVEKEITATDLAKYFIQTGQGGSSAYNTGGKGTLPSPPQSGKAGAVVEYPKGSGIYWTANADGTWR